MAGGENPGSGRPGKNPDQCIGDDLKVFVATEGFTENSGKPPDIIISAVRSRDGVVVAVKGLSTVSATCRECYHEG